MWRGLKRAVSRCTLKTTNSKAASVCSYFYTEDFAKWLVLKKSGKTTLCVSELVCNFFAYLNCCYSSWDWRVLPLDCHFGLIQCNLFWGLTTTSAVHSSPIFRPDLEFEILWSLTAITPAPLAYPSSGWLLMLGAIAITTREATISLKQCIWNRNI